MDDAVWPQTRIIIRVRVTDIPGEVCRRPITLGELFCTEILHRKFNTHIQRSGYDAVHVPGGFDSEQPLKRWFIYDLNVVEELEKDQLRTIPHSVYQAHLVNSEWVFKEHKTWITAARNYCDMFYWGGRTEQEMARELRGDKKAVTT